jgi:hypothetical protein
MQKQEKRGWDGDGVRAGVGKKMDRGWLMARKMREGPWVEIRLGEEVGERDG